MADRLAHPPHLPVAALVQDELEPGRAEPADAGRRRDPVLELDPFGERAQRVVVRLLPGLDLVDLLDAVAGMREPVRERAVVREQERAGRVDVEPPDRDDARLVVDEADDGGPPLRVAGGRDDAGAACSGARRRGVCFATGCPSTSTTSRDLHERVQLARARR